MDILTLRDVSYQYEGMESNTLNHIDGTFETGKVYVIMGKSGAGKSTILSLIAGLALPTEGRIKYDGVNLTDLDLDEYRAKNIGVVFQGYNLLTNATALDNVVLAMHISGSEEADKPQAALELLKSVGIDKATAGRKVLQLSGGEQQRIGIARAISHDPAIIIADEPTGHLDGDTEKNIMDIFQNLAHRHHKCVIIVTHSNQVAEYADKFFELTQGTLVLREERAV